MICTLSHIVVWNIANGAIHEYPIDSSGVEQLDGLVYRGESGEHKRFYRCTNCGAEIDGSESFEPTRQHIGKFHNVVNPFSPRQN